MKLTPEQKEALSHARKLVEWGVPVFVAHRKPHEVGTFYLPHGWPDTDVSLDAIDQWRPGDALCAVMGGVVDALDIDPRNLTDASREALSAWEWPPVYGVATTPSGGTHHLIAPQGDGKRTGVIPGLDLQGGRPDGSGRGFLFIAPTERFSKATGELAEYRWTVPPDLSAVAAHRVSFPSVGDNTPLLLSGTAKIATGTQAEQTLMSQILAVKRALPGERNTIVNKAAYTLGGFVGGQLLSENTVRQELVDACKTELGGNGLWDENTSEVIQLVDRGIADGKAVPFLSDVEFWAGRSDFWHIRQAAFSGKVSPLAVLDLVISRVIVSTPHWVMLPPLAIGRKKSGASLNFFVGVVGGSGYGKDEAADLAEELVSFPQMGLDAGGRIRWPVSFTTAPLGSGEGICHAYRVRTNKGSVPLDNPNVLFLCGEVDDLSAQAGRVGSTVMPQLRKMFQGQLIGFTYADPTRTVPLQKHSYRACLEVNIQPQKAGVILFDRDGGTPQRFLWSPSTDKAIPFEDTLWPGHIAWDLPREIQEWRRSDGVGGPGGNQGAYFINYPSDIREEIKADRIPRVRGEMDGKTDDESHGMLVRLKLAAGYALLGGRVSISKDDWFRAGLRHEMSKSVRGKVWEEIHEENRRSSVRKGKILAVRDLARDEEYEDREEKKVRDRILEVLGKVMDEEGREGVKESGKGRNSHTCDHAVKGGWFPRTKIGQQLSVKQKKIYGRVLELMVEEKVIEVCQDRWFRVT